MTAILVVDDEPQIVTALRINLAARGYQVRTAPDGETALRVAGDTPPDAIVLDLGLPGIEVIGRLRGWTTIPILVLSARADSASMVDALDAGADDYITKPFGMDEFLARLRAAIRRSATAHRADEEPLINADLEAHPPPEPPGGRRARGAWSKSAVGDILKNPKYTGYQVYNRRARRSRGGTGVYNPPEMWVWSVEPAHEPLIPKWMFEEFTARRVAKAGSRDGSEYNRHPNTKRAYVLRGRVLCTCGRRMLGHHHRGHNYYRCWPKNNNRGRMDRFQDHPTIVYMREDAILSALNTAFNDCLFSPQRMSTLTARVENVDNRKQCETTTRRTRLHKRVAELERKQENLLTQAEEADPRDPFTQGLRERYNALVAERQDVVDQIAELDRQADTTPSTPTQDELRLVETLPHLALNLHRAPAETQARLYELTKLSIHIDHETDHAMIEITLPAENIGKLALVAEAANQPLTRRTEAVGLAKPQVKPGVIAARAPGQAPPACTLTQGPFSMV